MNNFRRLALRALVPAALAAFLPAASARADLEPIKVGALLGVGVTPFPSVLGVNLSVELVEAVRAQLGFDIGKVGKAFVDGFSGVEFGAGYGFNARIPRLPVTPTAGISYSKNSTIGDPSKVYDDLTVSAEYITLQAGLEYHPSSTQAFVGAGVNLPWARREDQGMYHRVFGFYPYVSLGTTF